MKILVLTHRFPYPPVRGDCIRSWGEVEYLSRRHDVWLACVDRTRPAPADLARVRRCCRDVAIIVRSGAVSLFRGGLSLLVGGSLTEGYFHDARLSNEAIAQSQHDVANVQITGEKCPECGKALVQSGAGCKKCPSCGYAGGCG